MEHNTNQLEIELIKSELKEIDRSVARKINTFKVSDKKFTRQNIAKLIRNENSLYRPLMKRLKILMAS